MHFDLKRLLFVRLPVLLLAALLVGLPLMAVVWFITPLEYEASATLEFRASQPRVLNSASRTIQATSYEMYVNTQMAKIHSETVLGRVIQDPEIAKSPALTAVEDPIEYLSDHVDVSRVGRNSELVRISFRSPHRDAAREIVSRVVSAYLEYSSTEEALEDSARMKILLKERDNRQDELERQLKEKAGLALRMELPTGDMVNLDTGSIDIYREALVDAEGVLMATRSSVGKTEAKIGQVQELKKAHEENPSLPIYESGVEDMINRDALVVSLREQHARSEADLEQLESELAPSSDRLKSARSDAEALTRRLKDTENRVRGELLNSLEAQFQKELESYQKDAEDQEAHINVIQQRIGELESEYEARASKIATAQSEMDELDMRIEETRQQLTEVRGLIGDLALESEAPARVQADSHTFVPNSPDQKKRIRLAALVLVACLALGVGLGVLLELLDKHVHSVRDMKALSRLPVLAAIPHTKEDRLNESLRANMITADFPHSPIADEYRRILARIVYPPRQRRRNEFHSGDRRPAGVTERPPWPATWRFCSRAQGRHVLLVDTCGTAPSVEEAFGLTCGPGLAEVLWHDADVEDLARPTQLPGLDILGPGLRGSDLSSKLASRGHDGVSRTCRACLRSCDSRHGAVLTDVRCQTAGADSRWSHSGGGRRHFDPRHDSGVA